MNDEKEPPAQLKSAADEAKNKTGTDQDVIDGVPVFGVPQELIDKLPKDVRQQILLFISQQRFGAMPNPPNPMLGKVTEGHIDKLIDVADKDAGREHQDKNRDRWMNFACFVILILVFVFLVWFMTDKNTELLKTLLQWLLAFGGGVGFKALWDQRKNRDEE